MRIAFVGKGGAGKTTLAALLARFLAAQHNPVLCLDADINQNFAEAVGINSEDLQRIPELGNNADALKEFLRGSNPLISSASKMLKTTPPGRGSRMLKLDRDEDVWSRFSTTAGGMRFMRTGGFRDEDIGTHCYHSKTGAVELLLNHLLDEPQQYVIVDMTAGADSFASGLFTKFDLTVVVVEPTNRSVGVFDQYRGYAQPFNVPIVAIGNNIACKNDERFLRSHLADSELITFKTSDFIRRQDQTTPAESPRSFSIEELEPHNRAALAALKSKLDATEQNPEKRLAQTIEFHRMNCISWANALYGEDLRSQIDPEYTAV